MADLDVVVVGAGFAGIYAVHAMRSAGLTVRAFEAGSGIGPLRAEQHGAVDRAARRVHPGPDHARAVGRASSVEATERAAADWVAHVNDAAYATLFPCAESWYVGVNIPGKPRVFTPYVGGVGPYRSRCDAVAAAGYKGFTFTTVGG